MRKPIVLSTAVLCASSAGAHAVGFKTQLNCAGDYYSYCSQYSVGTPELRKCMRVNGPRLSKGCINALIEDGEVSKAEVEREKEKLVAAKAKAAEPKKTEVTAKKAAPEPKKTDVALKKPDAQPKQAEVATLKKPTAQTKKADTKIAAAPAPAKPQPRTGVIVRAAAAAPMPKAPTLQVPQVPHQTVSLDQKTFDALKARGLRFVEDDDDDSGADITPATPPPEPIEAKHQPLGTAPSPRVAVQSSPEVDNTTDSGDAASDATANTDPQNAGSANDVSDAVDATPRNPADYPPGRMSLGHGATTEPAGEQPTSWWSAIVRTFTGE